LSSFDYNSILELIITYQDTIGKSIKRQGFI